MIVEDLQNLKGAKPNVVRIAIKFCNLYLSAFCANARCQVAGDGDVEITLPAGPFVVDVSLFVIDDRNGAKVASKYCTTGVVDEDKRYGGHLASMPEPVKSEDCDVADDT